MREHDESYDEPGGRKERYEIMHRLCDIGVRRYCDSLISNLAEMKLKFNPVP